MVKKDIFAALGLSGMIVFSLLLVGGGLGLYSVAMRINPTFGIGGIVLAIIGVLCFVITIKNMAGEMEKKTTKSKAVKS